MRNGQLKISRCFPRTKTQLDLRERQLNPNGKFPRIYNIDYSSEDPERLGKEERGAGEFQRPDHLHVNVQ